jgi:hypothetical protein
MSYKADDYYRDLPGYGGTSWESWFAWHPVQVKRPNNSWQWVWLKRIERRVVLDNDPWSIVWGFRLLGDSIDYHPQELL